MTQAELFTTPTTLQQAHAAGAQGMADALAHAERETPSWGDLALTWIERYARQNALFTPEECNAAAMAWGLTAPPDDRAWGQPYRRAVLAGLIERGTVTYRRARGHGSVGVKWRSRVVA